MLCEKRLKKNHVQSHCIQNWRTKERKSEDKAKQAGLVTLDGLTNVGALGQK